MVHTHKELLKFKPVSIKSMKMGAANVVIRISYDFIVSKGTLFVGPNIGSEFSAGFSLFDSLVIV